MLSAVLLSLLIPAHAAEERRFEFAKPGYSFSFPKDHGSHPGYRTEWWYFTGNLEAEGRQYGYELTFFREGIQNAEGSANPSRWAVHDLYLAHFALTDPNEKKFHEEDRMSREAIGKAGAARDSLHPWIDDWEARLDGEVIHLHAVSRGKDWKIDLLLKPAKPLVFHGEKGVSLKGDHPGQASHYLSYTRLETEGTLWVNGKGTKVRGLSWMDHEFGSGVLNENQVGWDWFSIQLDDRTEVMLYQLRRTDGGRDPYSAGTIISADGKSRPLMAGDFKLTPLHYWKSEKSGANYPVGWKIEIPSEKLALESQPLFPDQELITSHSARVAYWEGASRFEGSKEGKPIVGRGYIELVGYAAPFRK